MSGWGGERDAGGGEGEDRCKGRWEEISKGTGMRWEERFARGGWGKQAEEWMVSGCRVQ